MIAQTQAASNTSSQTTSNQANALMGDLATSLLNERIKNDIEAFFNQLTKSEIELFKYLCYYYRKFNKNIQIPIKNLMNRFNLKKRRIQYILSRLNELAVIITLKKGHTGKATKRTLTDRGKLLWDGISKGLTAVKQVINRKSALSSALSPGGCTNNISSKVDLIYTKIKNKYKNMHHGSDEMVKFIFSLLKEACCDT